MQQWEYLVLHPDSSQKWWANGEMLIQGYDAIDHQHLNTFGEQGWELISVSSERGADYKYIFKRPRPQPDT
jgi:hypothetical protein